MIIDLDLEGRFVVVAGAGVEGIRKIDALLGEGCRITVFDRVRSGKAALYASQQRLEFVEADLADGSFLEGLEPYMVMAATDDHALNRRIVERARMMHCIAYAADDPENSDFAHPSVFEIKGVVRVAVSTGGRSPVMARMMRQRIEDAACGVITDEDAAAIRLQEFARKKAKQMIGSRKNRKISLYEITEDPSIKQLLKERRLKDAQERAMLILERWR